MDAIWTILLFLVFCIFGLNNLLVSVKQKVPFFPLIICKKSHDFYLFVHGRKIIGICSAWQMG